MSKITLNIVEPSGSTPVVPDTGLFTHGVGGTETTIIISAVILLAIVAIILAVCIRKKVQILETIKSKKRISAGLAAISLLVSACTFTAFTLTTGKSNTSAIEDNLTIDVSDEEFTIELADEPVFAVLPVEITVEEATEAGYTLSAYAESTDLVSTTNPDDVIPMVTVDEEGLVALANNTYGLSMSEPESQSEEVYTSLSTSEANPTFISNRDYEATEENDSITIYYGFYITPDVPYGTYTSSEVNYVANRNTTDFVVVTFDGNGLYFNNDPSKTTNAVKYIAGKQGTSQYSHTPNVNNEGEQDGRYATDLNETFVYDYSDYERIYFEIIRSSGDTPWGASGDYFSIWRGAHQDYTAKNDWDNSDSVKELNSDGKYLFLSEYDGKAIDIAASSMTLAYTTDDDAGPSYGSGYGYYAKITGYTPNVIVAGNYSENVGLEAAFRFLGWDTNKNATTPAYTSKEEIARTLDITSGEDITLYAIWEPLVGISYNGNGADSDTNMNNVLQYSANLDGTSQVDLVASNFKKEGYGFAGWSFDKDAWEHLTDDDDSNDPVIYGPNQTITIDGDALAEAGENRKLALSAVWVPAEQDASGNPVSLQGWEGCNDLTATIYDSNTGTLTVSKNTITALTDNRDGNVYAIARLVDENCWMIENLRLDNSADNASTTAEFSASNTNNPSLPLTNDFATQAKSNRLSPSSTNECTERSAACYDQSIINTRNTAQTAISPSFTQDFTEERHIGGQGLDENIYSYGNYYNWYSATAGNGVYNTDGNETVTGDICPNGWHLPYGGVAEDSKGNTSGGFSYLDKRGGGPGQGHNYSFEASNRWRTFPNNFVYSGYSSNGYSRGSYGYYWTDTGAYYDNNLTVSAYSLYLGYEYAHLEPGHSTAQKNWLYSVRCLVNSQD